MLGDFNGASRFIVALEGKGPRDPLDRPFAGRRMSAVDQGYRYAINLPCDWIIVTSIRQTRLDHKGSNQPTYERLLFLTDGGLCQFIEKLLLKPVKELQPARDAFLASYPKRRGGSRFTKVTMGVDADLALKRYFKLHELEVESWFNVIGPRGSTLPQLREDLVKLVGKDWKGIRQS